MEPPWSTLDLDQEEPFRREDEEVDLVDTPVVGDEFKIAPGAVGLVRLGNLVRTNSSASRSHGYPDSATLIQFIAEAIALLSEWTTHDAYQRLALELLRFDRSMPLSTLSSSARL